MSRIILRSSLFLLGIVPALPAAELINWLPADVNAVLSVRVADIYESRLAKRENWAAKARQAFVQHEVVIPPGLKQLAIGAELDLGNGLTPVRTFSVGEPVAGVSLEAVAAIAGAATFPLDGRVAVETPRGTVVVVAQPNIWLGTGQGGRQSAKRWAQTPPAAKSWATPLVGQSHIALAIDVADALSTDATDAFLSTLPETESKAAALAPLLADVKSLAWTVTVTDDIAGQIQIDFGHDASALAPVLKPLVPAVLQQFGMASSEVAAWTWSVRGKTVTGRGPQSAAETRRMLGILQHETPALTTTASASPADSGNDRTVAASKRYLGSVRTVLDDVGKSPKRIDDNDALTYERSARKIDDLPMKDVDAELLDFGQRVASSLRYQAQVQRMANIRGGTAKAQLNAASSYRYSGYGNGYVGPYGSYAAPEVGSSTANAAAIQATANLSARDTRIEEWKQIEEGLVKIRRRLTEKLNADF